MNAQVLVKQDGSPTDLAICGKCERTWSGLEAADRCCKCTECGEYCSWKNVISNTHDKCRDAAYNRVEQKRFDKAEKLTNWDGGVFLGDAYYQDLGECLDAIENKFLEGHEPEYVWACKAIPFRGLDIVNSLSYVCEDMYEDAYDDLEGIDELRAAVDKFNAANKGIASYEIDYSKAVLLSKPEVA